MNRKELSDFKKNFRKRRAELWRISIIDEMGAEGSLKISEILEFNWFAGRRLFWVRLRYGIGISVRDVSVHPLGFSERYGYKKFIKINKWIFTLLEG